MILLRRLPPRPLSPAPLLLAAVLLAACAPLAETGDGRPALPPPAEDTCGAAPLAGLVGREATALERVLLMREVRVIRPDTMVTMDVRPARINFEVGEDGRIFRIFCG